MQTPNFSTIILAAATCCLAANRQQASSAGAPTTNNSSFQITVEGSKQWVDTNIDVRAGEKVRFSATGEVAYAQQGKSQERKFGPDGMARGFSDVIHQYAASDAGHGALVARVGAADVGQPFLVGASKEFVAPVSGRLFLGINQSQKDASNAQGNFQVTIAILDPGPAEGAINAGGPAETSIPSLTAAVLEQIPRRVTDPQDKPGDMVNVLIVGSEADLVQVFTAAGWVKVDRSVSGSVVSGLLDTLQKKDYLTMPMSVLYLFKRPQDYGFAHAEAVRVAMSRNHLRAWKSPYLVEGRPLWCIAATHDIGFDRDQRNNGVTHKIDPAIDGEREYVNTTLSGTGLVVERTHVTPANPLKEAKTATGGTFNSDGRILVLVLKSGKSN
ncbi:MAG TPA: LssY C-terminal domain-containing protein [Terriglobales bacterium]